MSAPTTEPLIDPALAAWLQSGLSMIVASRDTAGRPSMMRGVGCRVGDDRRWLDVLVSAAGCGALLDDLRAGGPIAVVFSKPTTHAAAQFKARGARVVAANASDWALATQWQQQFAREIGPLGFPLEFIMSAFAWRPGDLHRVSLEPCEAYDQTPGARAGAPIGGTAR